MFLEENIKNFKRLSYCPDVPRNRTCTSTLWNQENPTRGDSSSNCITDILHTHLALDRPSNIMHGMESVEMEMTDKMTSINTMLVERVLPNPTIFSRERADFKLVKKWGIIPDGLVQKRLDSFMTAFSNLRGGEIIRLGRGGPVVAREEKVDLIDLWTAI